jgi:hypothetical protein
MAATTMAKTFLGASLGKAVSTAGKVRLSDVLPHS